MSKFEATSDLLSRAIEESGTRDSARAHETEAFDSIARGSRQIVIFGSGWLGQFALAGAKKAGLDVLAFADNNSSKWGEMIGGVPVLAPVETVSKYGDAVFVVGIFNGTPPREQLRKLGCKKFVPFPVFFWRFPESFPPCGIELPHLILDQVSAMRAGFETLDDDKSRQEFAAQIRWRCTLDYDVLPQPLPSADTYFSSELFGLSTEEVLVDCGAFDGDTIRMFLKECGNSFRHIYAVEPDPKNRAALQSSLSALLGRRSSDVSVLPFGVSDRDETVSFAVTGTAGSHITSENETSSIEVRRLDSILKGPDPTFIKMDIEGAEPEAIQGATQIIRRARPILAVCAYHRCEHLWTLPVLMKAALPEYRLFLRRYAEECWEMVYYAIPPERVSRAS